MTSEKRPKTKSYLYGLLGICVDVFTGPVISEPVLAEDPNQIFGPSFEGAFVFLSVRAAAPFCPRSGLELRGKRSAIVYNAYVCYQCMLSQFSMKQGH